MHTYGKGVQYSIDINGRPHYATFRSSIYDCVHGGYTFKEALQIQRILCTSYGMQVNLGGP